MSSSSSPSSSSSSNEDEFTLKLGSVTHSLMTRRGEGSRSLTRGPPRPRDRVKANDLLLAHYFNECCVYKEEDFRRPFQMSRMLFTIIVADLEESIEFFQQRHDTRNRPSFTGTCFAYIRFLYTHWYPEPILLISYFIYPLIPETISIPETGYYKCLNMHL